MFIKANYKEQQCFELSKTTRATEIHIEMKHFMFDNCIKSMLN